MLYLWQGVEERDVPGTSKEAMSRGRLKLKMEQSQRKVNYYICVKKKLP